jgi:hypothetical protein
MVRGFSNFLWARAQRKLLPNHCLSNMDRASQVLAQAVPPGVPKSYHALADHGNVPCSTLHHRARGRRSIEEKAQSQQYLTPWEEDVVVKFLLQMSDLGQPIRMKFVPSIAFSVTRQQPAATDYSSRPARTRRRLWKTATKYSRREESGPWTGTVTRKTSIGRSHTGLR